MVDRFRASSWRRGAIAVSLLAFGHVLYSAGVQELTYDEPGHLEWSRRLLETGETERESNVTFGGRTPILLPNVMAEKAARSLGPEEEGLTFAARAPTALWMVGLWIASFGMAARIGGREAGFLALAAVALDLNLVAHASLATVDAPFAAATLLTLSALHAFAAEPSMKRAALLGLALGAAFTAKYTAVLLLPAVLIYPLWPRFDPATSRGRAGPVLVGLLLAGAVACTVVGASYRFRDVGVRLSELRLRSSPMQAAAAIAPGLRLPLPGDFLSGLDAVIEMERSLPTRPYVLGRLHPDGVWYYFMVVWLLKTPLGFLAAVAYGLADGARSGRLWRDALQVLLLFHLAIFLFYFSFLFRMQIGFRFVLACVPLAYVLSAPSWGKVWNTRWGKGLVAAVLASAAAGHLMYLGNPLAYTNLAVQPKHSAFRLLADSNLCWGQVRLGETPALAERLDPPEPVPGLNVIDVNRLVGVAGDADRYRRLRENEEPIGHFGHCYVLFFVEETR